MSCHPTRATARKVQFKDPNCDDDPTAPQAEPRDDNTNSSLAGKIHFEDSVCDNPKLPFSKVEPTNCEIDPNSSLVQKDQIEDSICKDFNQSFAPKVESKDIMCDDVDLAHAQKVQCDEVRDDFNPAFVAKPCDDSVCDDVRLSFAPKGECKNSVRDDRSQSLAPEIEHKKETSESSPIPATAAKAEDMEKPWSPCANPGNPVFSCMAKFPTAAYSPVPFVKPQNPLFRTTSASYGSNQPTCEIAPSVYKPLTQSFSAVLQTGGMYRNRSLNTGSDKRRVHDLLPL
ncbi:uncharacterized protein LOC122541031 isoform X1 [Chiloscyllium plagiosum]|uniref:uncharacterized protein LOC122541031 isoform X1 n=1 Tax=Chiloscyllium plagiosum TaxID=36176 RepID=UPI001CB81F4A|nr:uncharacterized protein LOC122541031 isoform X1 [Chiloscyllium plagiosum]